MCGGEYEELCLWHWDQASCSSKLQPGPMPTVEDRRMDGGTHWSKEIPLPSPPLLLSLSTHKSSPAIDRLSFYCCNNFSVTFFQSVLKYLFSRSSLILLLLGCLWQSLSSLLYRSFFSFVLLTLNHFNVTQWWIDSLTLGPENKVFSTSEILFLSFYLFCFSVQLLAVAESNNGK